MINKSILKRIEALETAFKQRETPFLAFAHYDKSTGTFKILECFSKNRSKTIEVESMENDSVPEGCVLFSGEEDIED